jgi:hypothetical protein
VTLEENTLKEKNKTLHTCNAFKETVGTPEFLVSRPFRAMLGAKTSPPSPQKSPPPTPVK